MVARRASTRQPLVRILQLISAGFMPSPGGNDAQEDDGHHTLALFAAERSRPSRSPPAKFACALAMAAGTSGG
jgi:hypothetical protein